MSIRPKASFVSSTRRRSSSLDEMLAGIGFAASRPRARLMAAAVSAQASALRDETMTVAPCSASRSAMARPMPREEPVTIATRPLRSNRLVKISSRCAACRFDDCIVRRSDARGDKPAVRTLCARDEGRSAKAGGYRNAMGRHYSEGTSHLSHCEQVRLAIFRSLLAARMQRWKDLVVRRRGSDLVYTTLSLGGGWVVRL